MTKITKRQDGTFDLDFYDIESWNNELKKSKTCLLFLFPFPNGTCVEFKCKFDRFSKDRKNVCVNGIECKGNICIDRDESGDCAHLWFENVTNFEYNKQAGLWKKLQKGDRLNIRGIVWDYDAKNDNGEIFKKICIKNPEIISAYRGVEKIE